MNKIKTAWNPQLYNQQCDFVSQYGKDLLSLLAPQKNEHILDLGCGTGTLSNEIAQLGATVVGIDSSADMIEQAKQHYPHLTFEVADGHNFHFKIKFDAVFSNAALHWMLEPKKVIGCVRECLKHNGRFVLEMGGENNIRQVLNAVESADRSCGVEDIPLENYFPKLAQYTTLLEEQGFQVIYAKLMDRPTKLTGKEGLRNWVRVFRSIVLARIPEKQHPAFFGRLEEAARENLYHDDAWWADYVRLRVIALRS